jgi:hypothetical protein
MRFGTWNVRSLYRAGLLRAVAEEISKYRVFKNTQHNFRKEFLVCRLQK